MTAAQSNSSDVPELLPLGVDGILVRFAVQLSEEANTRAINFRQQVLAARLEGVVEAASSLASVRVGFDPGVVSRAQVTTALQALLSEPPKQLQTAHRIWKIPAAFGADYAPELPQAAALAGLSPDAAVNEITSQSLRVMAIGFAPGQPYLGLLPDHWNIPRQTELTKSMPRGALVAAVRQVLIFAADAPTGWRQIGQTAFDPYRPDRASPFAFAPGDHVQFAPVPDSEMADLIANSDCDGGATCERVD